MERVEIIVLKYKDPEVEIPCAQSIIENTDWPYKMVFYDTRGLGTNFSRIWNTLIKEATCDYVVIMDSDAKATPGWLPAMMSVYEKHSDVSAVVPRTNNCGNAPQLQVGPNDEIRQLAMGSGFCFLVKKDIFEKVGWFDEDFGVYGQDSEWFTRAFKMGYKVYLQPGALVLHIGNYSTKKAASKGEFDWAAEATAGGQLYKKKVQ